MPKVARNMPPKKIDWRIGARRRRAGSAVCFWNPISCRNQSQLQEIDPIPPPPPIQHNTPAMRLPVEMHWAS